MDLSPTILWAIFGIALIIAELFALSFVLVFFGASALVVALVKHFGLDNLAAEIFIFALAGLLSLVVFRKKMIVSVKGGSPLTFDANKKLELTEDIPAGRSARIIYQGTSWTAHNTSTRTLKTGETAFIEKTDGINLFVNALENLRQEK